MKTITFKADDDFDQLLSRLAAKLNTTRSAVIREAVRGYEHQLEREALRQQLVEASRRTRAQAAAMQQDLDSAIGDGL